VHAADEASYAEIYRYGSLQALRSKLERVARSGLAVDLSFVAMDRNLDQLAGVGRWRTRCISTASSSSR